MTTVPYGGGAPAYVYLMAGQVEVMYTSPNPTLSYARAGKLPAIAMTGAKRSPAAPQLPVVAETAGFRDYEASLWYGIVAPAGTSPDIVRLLNNEIVKAAHASDFRSPLEKYAFEVIASSTDAFARHIGRELEKWSRVIKEADIRAD